jgi:type I 3-dehydroquinase
MIEAKPITLRGKPLAGGVTPVICTPLIGDSREELLAEVAAVLPMQPDVIEWRADYFAALADTDQVIDTARALKVASRGLPILFTCRAASEGGRIVSLSEPRVVQLYEAVSAARCVDLIDYELSQFSVDARCRGGARQVPRSTNARRRCRQGRGHAPIAWRRADAAHRDVPGEHVARHTVDQHVDGRLWVGFAHDRRRVWFRTDIRGRPAQLRPWTDPDRGIAHGPGDRPPFGRCRMRNPNL